jgi:hypothetical protein
MSDKEMYKADILGLSGNKSKEEVIEHIAQHMKAVYAKAATNTSKDLFNLMSDRREFDDSLDRMKQEIYNVFDAVEKAGKK